jgi:hypothetical protein
MYSVASVTTRLGTQAGQEHDRDGDARVLAEQARGQVGRQPEDRPHRQVDVPADHHHRLAQRQQREDRGVDQHELDVRRAEEPVPDRRGNGDEHHQDHEDARFAQPEDPLGQPARPLPAGRAGPGASSRPLVAAAGDHRPHHAAASCCPMAADMIASSVACS